ncbi:MAG: lipid-A-disaccharide synthase, partial [Mesorhizobium sp.]
DLVRSATANWNERPEIVTDPQGKWRAFGLADAALIASGTVSLELALSGVPMISCYRFDPVMQAVQSLVKIWTGVLPNLIADRPVVPESYNSYVRPMSLARYIEGLWSDTQLRGWQKDGFAEVRRRMTTAKPSGEIAAAAVMELVKGSRAVGQ